MPDIKATDWKSTQLMSNKSYELNYYRDKDFKTVQMHSHDFYELYFFIRGSASYIIENGHYSLQPGDVLLIPPNKLHQLDIKDSSETYERAVLWINPVYLKKMSTSKTDLSVCFLKAAETNAYLVRNPAVSDRVQNALEALQEHTGSTLFGCDIAAELQIKGLLLTLGTYYLEPSDMEPRRAELNKVIAAAVDYITAHIAENLSLDTLAQTLFVNKYYLAHLFKEETNTSPHRYILKKRLVLSKQLIESGLPVTEVYSKCGFSDYTHYFRAFKSEYGITPKQYFTLISR